MRPSMSRDLDAFCAGIEDDICSVQLVTSNPYDCEGKSVTSFDWTKGRDHSMISTHGHLGSANRAFVYVSVQKHGRVKVGMSSKPGDRCKDLGTKLFYAHEVQVAAARQVETEVLRTFGKRIGDDEWVIAQPEHVADVVKRVAARFRVEKYA